jgi:hypothetical protein
LDEQVAIATRLEIEKWFNPATEVTELVVRIIIHTGEGVTESVYRPHDLMELIGDLMKVVEYLMKQGLDEDEEG